MAAARAVIFAQMVDDPSAYVDVLRADPKLRRKGESALRARRKVWEEAKAVAKKAEGTGLSVAEVNIVVNDLYFPGDDQPQESRVS